jgi:hypothetical protein
MEAAACSVTNPSRRAHALVCMMRITNHVYTIMQVRAELDKARMDLEKEGRSTQIGKLCATPFGVDIVGITELVALIGALVGGGPSFHQYFV